MMLESDESKNNDSNWYWPWHQPELQQLTDAYGAEKLHHALLFCGPENLGKLRLATRLSSLLLCQQSASDSREKGLLSCGACSSCRLVAAGTHPDCHLVYCDEGHQSIAIERVRSVREQLLKKPQVANAKVCVVNPADALNENSANALLKLLEEPPANTYFLLISHRVQKLLPTIKSRCIQIKLGMPGIGQVKAYLEDSFDSLSVDRALAAARGFPERALALLSSDNQATGIGHVSDSRAFFNGAILKELSAMSSKGVSIAELEEVVDQLQLGLNQLLIARQAEQHSGGALKPPNRSLESLQYRLCRAKQTLAVNPNTALFVGELISDIRRLFDPESC